MTELRSTYLVQRLKKPYKDNADNPFNFGGGLLHGGMNEEGYRTLNQIFTFDYMGSAEFEFGAVPKAIDAIARGFEEGNGVTGKIEIEGVPIYYLTHKNAEKETRCRIHELANNQYKLKEWSYFIESISANRGAPMKREDALFAAEYIGWIELNNNFIFFVDKEAFEKFNMLVES